MQGWIGLFRMTHGSLQLCHTAARQHQRCLHQTLLNKMMGASNLHAMHMLTPSEPVTSERDVLKPYSLH